MTKHTPGPWHVGKPTVLDNHGFKVHAFPVAGNGQAIAAVWNGTVGKEATNFGNQAANAALVAAAPDLFVALRRLLDDIDRRRPDMESIDKARAALAKAEGSA